MNVTVGVIARNEMPYLKYCLDQLESFTQDFSGHPGELQFSFLLVDSSSQDGSRECMLDFASRVDGVKVFQLSGEANAAIARNIVLDNMDSGALLMLDGDVVPSTEFLEQSINLVKQGRAAVVVGGLEEVYYDQSGKVLNRVPNRYSGNESGYLRLFDGIFFISETGLQGHYRFKEYMDLSEDRDFSLRVSREFTCLRIPASMGVHHTQSYLSRNRVGKYLSKVQPKWAGLLIRNFITDVSACREIIRRERGAFVAMVIQLIVLAMLLASAGIIALVPLIIDYFRFFLKGRPREYFYAQIITPWMIVYGLLVFRPKEKYYTFSRLA